MKKVLFLCFVFIMTYGFCQNKNPEFQGLIKYSHNVIVKDKNYDVNYDYSGIGKSSDYYFKNGNIKWLTYDCYFKMSLFLANENRDYFLTKTSDTIFAVKNNSPDFDVLEYKVTDTDTKILGHTCKVLTLKLKPLNAETPITYRRYYFSSDFSIDPKKFAKCTSNAYDIIYGNIKSIPLKIEYEFANRTVIWEAVEIKQMKLEDDFFKLEKGAIIGYW